MSGDTSTWSISLTTPAGHLEEAVALVIQSADLIAGDSYDLLRFEQIPGGRIRVTAVGSRP